MKKELPATQANELLDILKVRFEKNMNRHMGLDWATVEARLRAHPEKLWSLNEMEITGGEPDVVGMEKQTGEYIFFIVRMKARKVGGMFVMTMRHLRPGNNSSLKT